LGLVNCPFEDKHSLIKGARRRIESQDPPMVEPNPPLAHRSGCSPIAPSGGTGASDAQKRYRAWLARLRVYPRETRGRVQHKATPGDTLRGFSTVGRASWSTAQHAVLPILGIVLLRNPICGQVHPVPAAPLIHLRYLVLRYIVAAGVWAARLGRPDQRRRAVPVRSWPRLPSSVTAELASNSPWMKAAQGR
jgi:hypothetical protein